MKDGIWCLWAAELPDAQISRSGWHKNRGILFWKPWLGVLTACSWPVDRKDVFYFLSDNWWVIGQNLKWVMHKDYTATVKLRNSWPRHLEWILWGERSSREMVIPSRWVGTGQTDKECAWLCVIIMSGKPCGVLPLSIRATKVFLHRTHVLV